MLKQLNQQDLFRLLEQLAISFQLLVPQTLVDGTRGLLPWNGSQTSMSGEPLQRKPTALFFPQTDHLVHLGSDGMAGTPAGLDKPVALCGLNREDLAGIAFIDRFFATQPADDIYLKKRTAALIIGLTGYVGREQQFQPLAEGQCDFELIADQQHWLAVAYTESGKHWLADYPDGPEDVLQLLRETSRGIASQHEQAVKRASQLLQAEQVPDSFWEEISARCIRCGGCNFACPTCTCFCVQDRKTINGIERSRIWDSCQLDAFMREASGHNPMGTELLRTRRRIHHKLVDDPQRWGETGCILCGRCDRACPTGIGMFAICDEIVSRFDR
jgi:ferredoxin